MEALAVVDSSNLGHHRLLRFLCRHTYTFTGQEEQCICGKDDFIQVAQATANFQLGNFNVKAQHRLFSLFFKPWDPLDFVCCIP